MCDFFFFYNVRTIRENDHAASAPEAGAIAPVVVSEMLLSLSLTSSLSFFFSSFLLLEICMLV